MAEVDERTARLPDQAARKRKLERSGPGCAFVNSFNGTPLPRAAEPDTDLAARFGAAFVHLEAGLPLRAPASGQTDQDSSAAANRFCWPHSGEQTQHLERNTYRLA